MFSWFKKRDVRDVAQEMRGDGNIQDPSVPLTGGRILDYLTFGGASSAGVPVTRKTVLGIPAYLNGVRLISTNVAKLPIKVWRRLPEGGKDQAKEHPAWSLVTRQPNPYVSCFDFVAGMTATAITQGAAYAVVLRHNGMPWALIQVPTDSVVVGYDRSWGEVGEQVRLRVSYGVTLGGVDRVIEASDVVHIKNVTQDGVNSVSSLATFKDVLGISVAKDRYTGRFFSNNATPNLVIEFPGQLKDAAAIDRFRRGWASIHQGVDNQFRPAILESGAKASPMGVSPEAAQLPELDERQLVALANILGIQPHKLGANIATSYASLEAENRSFLNDTLSGWLCQWKQQFEKTLLKDHEREDYLIESMRDELERSDRQTEAAAHVLELNNGIRSLDEIRARLNLPPLPEGLGASYRIPLNHGILGQDDPREGEPDDDAPEPDESNESPDMRTADLTGEANTGKLEALERELEEQRRRFAERVSERARKRLTNVVRRAQSKRKVEAALEGMHEQHHEWLAEEFGALLPSTGAEELAAVALSEVRAEMAGLMNTSSTMQLRSAIEQIAARLDVELQERFQQLGA